MLLAVGAEGSQAGGGQAKHARQTADGAVWIVAKAPGRCPCQRRRPLRRHVIDVTIIIIIVGIVVTVVFINIIIALLLLLLRGTSSASISPSPQLTRMSLPPPLLQQMGHIQGSQCQRRQRTLLHFCTKSLQKVTLLPETLPSHIESATTYSKDLANSCVFATSA